MTNIIYFPHVMLVVTLIVAPENWMNMTDKEPDYREIWNSKKGKRKKKD